MNQGKTHDHTPEIVHYTFGPHEPALRVAPGDFVSTKTMDSGNRDETLEQIPAAMRGRREGTSFRESNPLTGPFYVEGAEAGDVLVVRIVSIVPNREVSFVRTGLDRGGLAWGIEAGLSLPAAEEGAQKREYSWHVDRERGTARLDLPHSRIGQVEIPLNPHFGCIGVAPKWGQTISSIVPADHGGNMDCVETGPGTTVYLPVFVRGAYLLVGDVHAAQGDGELCGGGLDITADVTVEVGLIKGRQIAWPRLENTDYIMTAASTLPLFDAYRLAQVELIKWMEEDYGFDALDSLNLLTQVGESRVGNVVDPQFTVVAKIAKRYLPDPGAGALTG